MSVALVHDYLTQRGGAERVVLSMLATFPDAPLYTSLYEPALTFAEFDDADVRTSGLNRSALLRRNHRLALPLLAPAFSRMRVDADVVVCSSSGWGHGAHATGRKVVYCHAPARWLYQRDRYVGRVLRSLLFAPLRRRLLRWDAAAAASAHRYVVNSNFVRDRVRALYGIDAEVLHPPHAAEADRPRRAVAGLDEGFVLCVSRLLPYKNVQAVVAAFRALPAERLVVVGAGPLERRLRRDAPPNVRFVGAVADDELRWLYSSSRALVAAAYEDFGLTPLEAAAFGRPTAALRFGGFLDTIREHETGVFFDEPSAGAIAGAVSAVLAREWSPRLLEQHAATFSEERFTRRLREIVAEELELSGSAPKYA